MEWLNELLGMKKKPQAPQQNLQSLPVRGKVIPPTNTQQAGAPEITFNPNPNTNIPYSTHSQAEAIRGNRYVNNPQSPEFLNVDPKIWGFPADEQVQPQSFKASQRPRVPEMGRKQLYIDPAGMSVSGIPQNRRRSSLDELLNF